MPSSKELKRQLAFTVPLSEWRAVSAEACRRNVTVPGLLREWLAEPIKRLLDSRTKEGSNQK